MVVNAMIATATAHSGESGIQTIYHVGSSFQNPVTFGQLHETTARYFTKKPLVARNGSPIIVTKGTLLSTMGQFSLYITLRYKLPLLVLLQTVLSNYDFSMKFVSHLFFSFSDTSIDEYNLPMGSRRQIQ